MSKLSHKKVVKIDKQIVKVVKYYQNCQKLSKFQKLIVKMLARLCFLIILIKCLKGYRSLESPSVSDKVTYCAVLDTSVFPIHNKWRVREGGRVCTFWTVIWSSRVFPLQQTGQWWGLRGRICTF